MKLILNVFIFLTISLNVFAEVKPGDYGVLKAYSKSSDWTIVLSGGYQPYSLSGRPGGIGTILPYGGPQAGIPDWTKEGNRWLVIRQGLYVDLNTNLVIEGVSPTRKLQKND
jgi:hypothetical protein